jgi:hypothetical protein
LCKEILLVRAQFEINPITMINDLNEGAVKVKSSYSYGLSAFLSAIVEMYIQSKLA